ncbi:MAG: hypothetical protein LJE91_17715 [Gammaproteobacteria bacterium]|nr:hypothetical protein [Gammaproteobacteria bacterium]
MLFNLVGQVPLLKVSGAEVTHFKYFSNEPTVRRLIAGLTRDEHDHGGFRPFTTVADIPKTARAARRKGPQPLVFVLPGILGSHLEVRGNRVWVDPGDLLIGSVYYDLVEYLRDTHEVVPFPFDWRRSVREEAARLAEVIEGRLGGRGEAPVRILAHSMGGLVTRADGNPLRPATFLATRRGDGRVPWDQGIPEGAPTWFAEVVHGDLPKRTEGPFEMSGVFESEDNRFEAIREILETGNTGRLPKSPPVVRGEETEPFDLPVAHVQMYPDEAALVSAALGSRPEAPAGPRRQIRASVAQGNLGFARHPVMVGHYQGDMLISAEAQLDRYLDGRLSKRHRLGYYPGPIETCSVILKPPGQPGSAIVVGLGEVGQLTPNKLARSIKRALIEYTITRADWATGSEPLAVTSLLIGTSAGGLSVLHSMSAILDGVVLANESIADRSAPPGARRLLHIGSVEFLELFEDRAVEAATRLRQVAALPRFQDVLVAAPRVLQRDAVLHARQRIRQKHPGVNTWGAYQCYGDPDFTLARSAAKPRVAGSFVTPSQVVTELNNLTIEAKTVHGGQLGALEKRLEAISDSLDEGWASLGAVQSAFGAAYGELGIFHKAVSHYENALEAEDGRMDLYLVEQEANLKVRWAADLATAAENGVVPLIRDAIKSLNALIGLGETVERYSMLASACKRYALVTRGSPVGHLKRMSDHYRKAYELKLQRTGEIDPYPLLNWLTGVLIIERIGTARDRTKAIRETMDRFDELTATVKTHLTKQAEWDTSFWNSVMAVDCDLLVRLKRGGLEKKAVRETFVEAYRIRSWTSWKPLRIFLAEAGRGSRLRAPCVSCERIWPGGPVNPDPIHRTFRWAVGARRNRLHFDRLDRRLRAR